MCWKETSVAGFSLELLLRETEIPLDDPFERGAERAGTKSVTNVDALAFGYVRDRANNEPRISSSGTSRYRRIAPPFDHYGCKIKAGRDAYTPPPSTRTAFSEMATFYDG
jgi:hypothetical protein